MGKWKISQKETILESIQEYDIHMNPRERVCKHVN
jgi:hypothetical protein